MTAIRLKNLAKEALLAVLIAAWIVGLAHQFESWSTTIVYFAISLVMVGVVYGSQILLGFSPRQNRRR
jgi:membrane protease YdiL (CAAX protease family)